MKALKYCCGCCWWGVPCSLCGIFPIRESTSTRLIYTFLLFICLMLCVLSHKGTLESFNVKCDSKFNATDCEIVIGFIAIYRICTIYALFHLFLCLVTTPVVQSTQILGRLHNGFWLWKLLLLGGLWTVAYYYLPHPLDVLYQVITVVGVVASFLLIIIQQIALIDCAYEFNGWLRTKTNNGFCYAFVVGLIVCVIYFGIVTWFILMFVFYGLAQPCTLNRIFIGINGCLIAFCSLVTFLAKRGDEGGFTPAIPLATTCGYITFLTWTAMSSEPAIIVPEDMQLKRWEEELVHRSNNTNLLVCNKQNDLLATHLGQELHAFAGLVIMAVLIVYSSLRTSMSEERVGIKVPRMGRNCQCDKVQSISSDVEFRQYEVRVKCSHPHCDCLDGANCDHKHKSKASQLQLTQSSTKLNACSKEPGEEENIPFELRQDQPCCTPADKSNKFIIWDDMHGAHYSYPWFHFVYALASFFIMANLTDWINPKESHFLTIGRSWATVWMKMASSWIVTALFLLSLVLPGFCIGRNLSQFHADTLKRNRRSVKQKRMSQIRESMVI